MTIPLKMIETSFWIAARDNSKMIGTRFLGSAAEDSNWPPTAPASPPSPAPSAHYAEQTASLTLFLAGTLPDKAVLCQPKPGPGLGMNIDPPIGACLRVRTGR